MATKIVVIGGGFAGVKCVKALRKKLGKMQCEIVVFASENHMVFHPLLAEVASASINPKDMAAPLRALLKDVHIRVEEVSAIDLESSEISYESFDKGTKKLKYDQLVIACGNTSNLAIIPGMADHAFPMKTVGDALALQLHIINQMERAEICADSELKKKLLTFVVVGGGFSGVEIAGEIHDFMTRSAKYYSNFVKTDINVTLVHSREQILPEVSSSLRDFAQKKMEKNGIRFILNTGAAFCTSAGVGLKNGSFLQAATVICTIGSRPLPVIEKLAVPKDRGRILVNADMSVPGYANAWSVGDCAAVVNAFDGAMSPTTGQFAERQGTQVAENMIARMQGQQTKPFKHRSLGVLCSIGGKSAVADSMGIKISGFLAWMAWRGTYLFKLPSLVQQIGVGLTWLFGLWFPPALMAVRTDQTKKMGNAHYQAGDWVFRQGDLANEFYVIREGEVEVVSKADGEEYTLAVLGKGDFFGEGSLMDNTLRRHSCRAKTDVELLVLGRHAFEQISHTLSPLRAALASAMKRRQVSWEGNMELKHVLDRMPLAGLVEPVSSDELSLASTLSEAVKKMNERKLDLLYVVDDRQKLEGLVSRTDLMRAMESNAGLNAHERAALPAKVFMVSAPICAAQTDSTTGTLMTMREHGFKRIPVVDNHQSKILLGTVRAENMIATALNNLLSGDPA